LANTVKNQQVHISKIEEEKEQLIQMINKLKQEN